MIAVEHLVQAVAKKLKGSDGLKTCHSHQYSKEEKNSAHVYARKHVGHTLLHAALLLFARQTGVEHLSHSPQHSQHEQYAHKRRQVGDGLEHRHKYQSAYAKEEHCLALHLCKMVLHTLVLAVVLHLHLSLQAKREDIRRHQHRHHRRQEHFHDDTRRRQQPLVPQHDSGHVAYRRKGTAGVG